MSLFVEMVQEKAKCFQSKLNPARIPRHVAIIPDGNRRWAKKRASTTFEGHREGADSLMEIVKAAKELGIQILTFYSFSTENWLRSQTEIDGLMFLFTTYLQNQCEEMVRNGIKLETIGDLSKMPADLNQVIHETKMATKNCDKIQLVLALNYGSRNELCRAFKAMLEDVEHKKLDYDEINESTITRYLDTGKWQDPELLIRTSGELRLSNFLLWQLSYSEIYVAPVLWPDFTPDHLVDAIIDYQKRDRRWGE